MDQHQIWVERDHRRTLLSERPQYQLDDLARWTGLRMGCFAFPNQAGKAHFYSANPLISLFVGGHARADVQWRLRSRSLAFRCGDMTCFPGDMEMRRSMWRADGARTLAVEIDRARLSSFVGADEGLADKTLTGQAHFTDDDLARLMGAMWQEIQTGCQNGRLYAESLSLGLASHVFRRFGAGPQAAKASLNATQLSRVEQCLRARLAEPIGLSHLAEAAGLSVSHFARSYRNTTGTSPYRRLL
ncbi:MAG: hypothetical protein H7Y33_12855, partial [Cytophagales bacterium]|nr:hypothetical protein [Rhizobacter sp.]